MAQATDASLSLYTFEGLAVYAGYRCENVYIYIIYIERLDLHKHVTFGLSLVNQIYPAMSDPMDQLREALLQAPPAGETECANTVRMLYAEWSIFKTKHPAGVERWEVA